MTDRLLLAQISVDVRDVQKQMQRAGFAVDTAGRRMAQNWRSTTQSMSRDTEQFGRDVRRAIASIALATVARDVTELADAWTRAGNQISAAAAATSTAGVSLSTIADIARGTRTEFDATATLYARLTRATGDLGASQEQVIEATRLINQAFVAGGASAQEQASAVVQLSQALSSGVLQGDELRSLRESSPLLLAAIAKEFGVAQGALKALGAEGKLTSDRIFSAVLKAAPEIEAQFSVTQATVADSFTNLRTAAVEYAGTLNQSLGVTTNFGSTVDFVADNFETFADALLIGVTLLGARGLGGALNKASGEFLNFSGGFLARRRDMLKTLEQARDATAAEARDAVRAYQLQKDELYKLQIARQAAAKSVAADPTDLAQNVRLNQLRKEEAQALKELDAVNQKLKPSQLEVTAAYARHEAAVNRLKAAEAGRTTNVKQMTDLDRQIEQQQNRITAGLARQTAAQNAAALANLAYARASNLAAATFRSTLAFFGGPLGVAIFAVGAAMAYFTSETVKANRAVSSVNEALSILAEGYGVTEGLQRDAAGASAELTAQLKAQKDATQALAEIERQNRRDKYIEAMEAARDRVEKLKKEVDGATGATLNLANAFRYNAFTPKDEFNEKLTRARDDLADMTRYLGILEAGFQGLEAIGFEKPKVSTELAPVTGGTTESESDMKARLKAEASAAKRAAEEAEALIEGIQEAWRGYYEWKDEAISRELADTLDAIDKAALTDTQKIKARQQANETASAARRDLIEEEILETEEAAKAKQDAADREIDAVARILDERDRMLGRTLSIIDREYERRRQAINDEIKDGVRRNEALAALATEEAEFKRQAALNLADIDERSDAGSEVRRVQEIMQAKLDALQEGYDLELIQLEEFEAAKREIIADSEAEIEAIRAASGQALLAGAEAIFGALASLASTFAGQQSGIFKALFFAEKAFALASAYVNMQLAIAKANASAPAPLNAPAILAAKVTGAAAIAGIIASTAAGFKKGGYTGDGDPNTVAGVAHRGEYVFDAKATKRLGKQNLEALRSGRALPSTIAAPVAKSAARNVSFGDMILNVSGNGAAEIRDELAGMLAAARQDILSDVDKGFGRTMAREVKTTTPRHKRDR